MMEIATVVKIVKNVLKKNQSVQYNNLMSNIISLVIGTVSWYKPEQF